jgi:hypothetical protein
MNARLVLPAVAMLICGWTTCANPNPGTKPVMVYYMPWYVANTNADGWGWHWTMNHFDPEKVDAAGDRNIASWYYPLIGPYDSTDPAVLEYHVLLMKIAGVDGVIVDWYGNDNFLDYAANNSATLALLNYARKAGLKLALCYEDQTIQHMISGSFLDPSNALSHAQNTMRYVQTNFFSNPTYFRWQNKPLLLNFGPQYFKGDTDWIDLFSVLDAVQRPAFFTEDNRVTGALGAFNWPPMWMSQSPSSGGVLSETALQSYLSDFDQKAAAWPSYISSVFPRFHDIYQQAGTRQYMGYLGDHSGSILRQTLNRAVANDSAIVQIVTWNDYGEGTIVEPTREYGFRDLGIIQEVIREKLKPGLLYRTNDFELAIRLFQLRRESDVDKSSSVELDRIFTHIIAGDTIAARESLRKLEALSRTPHPQDRKH